MKRIEYLQVLEKKLKYKLPKREINEIIRDYAEYFVEGERQAKTEEQLSSELGAPEIIAKQLVGDHMQNLFKRERKERVKVKESNVNVNPKPNDEKKLLKYLLITAIVVVSSPLWGALLLVAICSIFAVLLLVFCLVAATGAVGFAGILCGIAALAVAVMLFGFLPNTVIIFLVLIAVTALFSVFTIIGCLSLFIRMIYRIIVKKNRQNSVSVAQDILDEVSTIANSTQGAHLQESLFADQPAVDTHIVQDVLIIEEIK